MEINKLFVSYDLALLAKEKGFDEECFMDWKTPVVHIRGSGERIKRDPDLYKSNHYVSGSDVSYINEIAAPLYQQLVDWFREKHDIHIWIVSDIGYTKTAYTWYFTGDATESKSRSQCSTYYEGLNEALTEAFKLI